MTNLMVGNRLLFILTEYAVFLFLAGNDHLHGFPKIILGYRFASGFCCSNGCLVYHIGQV